MSSTTRRDHVSIGQIRAATGWRAADTPIDDADRDDRVAGADRRGRRLRRRRRHRRQLLGRDRLRPRHWRCAAPAPHGDRTGGAVQARGVNARFRLRARLRRTSSLLTESAVPALAGAGGGQEAFMDEFGSGRRNRGTAEAFRARSRWQASLARQFGQRRQRPRRSGTARRRALPLRFRRPRRQRQPHDLDGRAHRQHLRQGRQSRGDVSAPRPHDRSCFTISSMTISTSAKCAGGPTSSLASGSSTFSGRVGDANTSPARTCGSPKTDRGFIDLAEPP